MSHRVRLRRENGFQVLSIPRSLELEGEEVEIDVTESGLVLRAVDPGPKSDPNAGLIALLKTLEPIDIEWSDPEDPPPEPVDLGDWAGEKR